LGPWVERWRVGDEVTGDEEGRPRLVLASQRGLKFSEVQGEDN
jgi:hypothetical protein